MKALIHIGIPKSGTSSIQAFLGLNRAALLGQGIVYAPFDPNSGSQFEFPVTALEACGASVGPELERRRLGFGTRASQTAYVAAYRSFLDTTLNAATGGSFIGSSEHIYAWLTTPERIAALDRFLSARFTRVRYLVYLRPQDDLIASAYSEAVRRGATHDFQTHMDRHARMNHWTGLKPWRRVIGPARLLVRLMCPDALTDADLLTDFCAIAGIDRAGLPLPQRVNAALSAGDIAVRRRLNAVLPVLGHDGHPHALYRLALRGLAPLARRCPDRIVLSDAQRDVVLGQNHAGNEKIRKRYFRDRPGLF